MEIRERIESCLSALDARQRMIAAYETKVRAVIETLKATEGSPGAVPEMLAILEEVLRSYGEISLSCGQMIGGLTEIGEHVERIEDGRAKIVAGVEAILSKLAHLEALAAQGIQVGVNAPAPDEQPLPRRILLVRIRPNAESDQPEPVRQESTADPLGIEDDLDEALRFLPRGKRDTTVH